MIFEGWSFVTWVLRSRKKHAFILIVLISVSMVTEALGLAALLPLFEVLTLGTTEGKFGFLFKPVLSLFPPQYLVEIALLLVFLLYFVKYSLLVVKEAYTAWFANDLVLEWRESILSNFLFFNFASVITKHQGHLMENLVNQPSAGSKYIKSFFEYVFSICLAIVLFVFLFSVSMWITLGMVVVFGSLALLFGPRLRRYSGWVGREKISLAQGINANAAESIYGIRQIKIFSLEPRQLKGLRSLNVKYRDLMTWFTSLEHLPKAISEFLVVSFTLVALGYFHFNRQVDFAQILPTVGVFLLASSKFTTAISGVINQRIKIISQLPTLELIKNLSNSPDNVERVEKGLHFSSLKESIQIRDVDFSYGEQPVLKKFNLELPLRGLTMVTGPSGCGKSTVADLLLGLFNPQAGAVLINRRDLREYDITSWRAKIGYVSQDPLLFNVSIKENIALGRPDAKEEEILRAAELAEVTSFLGQLENGIDTIVGDRGLLLSGGQRQRVTIARALVRNPEFLIFDEATSALDDETSERIDQLIVQLSKERTTLVISHKNSIQKQAHYVLRLGPSPSGRAISP